MAALWDGCVDTLWSIALAVEGEEVSAMAVLASLQGSVAAHAPGLDPGRGWTEQVVERLYLLLTDGLRPLEDVLAGAGPARAGWSPEGGEALEQMPRELRAVFVFHLLGGMSMAAIAALLGEDEMAVRRARTWVSYRLVSARGGGL